MVIFSQKETSIVKVPSNVFLLSSSRNQVRNIERAITQVCDPKGYAVFLKAGDKFNEVSALAIIAANVEERNILGGFINLKIKGNFH